MPDLKAQNPARTEVAIACGGTGGHLFPGVAVGKELLRRGCAVTLLVSPKEVDQQAVRSITGMKVETLPAVGLQGGNFFGFAAGFWKSYRRAKSIFAERPPRFALAMGGFTSVPPILAARALGARTFLHESNTIPGKANRWLARVVDCAFVYFDQTAPRLRPARAQVAGMPVRSEFLEPMRPEDARRALGLSEVAPTLLVMGGSQGARGVNQLVAAALPKLLAAVPTLQFIHLTGTSDLDATRLAYQRHTSAAFVRPFFDEMALALAAADVAVSRAGASSLAELAARQLPSVLIPFPAAADDHQTSNARAFADSGAARWLKQETTTPDKLADAVIALLQDGQQRDAIRRALEHWRNPQAAAQIADAILHWPDSRQTTAPVNALKTQTAGAIHA